MNDHKEPSKEEILKKHLRGLRDSAAVLNQELQQSNAKLIEALEAVVNFHPAHGIDVLKEYINKVLKENKK